MGHRVRLSKVVADYDDLQTQSRCIHLPFQWTRIKKEKKAQNKIENVSTVLFTTAKVRIKSTGNSSLMNVCKF